MTLRGRLFAFNAAQLVGFGLILAIGYYALETDLLPTMYRHLEDRANSAAIDLAVTAQVPLGGDDANLLDTEAAGVTHDSAFSYLEVRTATGALFDRNGMPRDDAFSGPPGVAVAGDGVVHSWADITVEGLKLGKISVGFDTSRVDRLDTLITSLALAVLGLWLAAVVYSIVFARAFVAPIREMMEFSRKVAGGNFSERLAGAANGELLELRDYLNTMTQELELRDRERVAAAARDEAMQRELVEVSRMAGMAEIATGVLHNVGNVLNSLNVSVSIVGDQLRDSKVASLSRTVDLYAAHPGGFDAFMATDKGKLLPQFLTQVSKRLVEENAQARGELATVIRNVDHIKTIVATQQRYANTFGAHEEIDLAGVIGDALKMAEASFVRHRIELVRDFPEAGVPAIDSDRHKLLQILINLISNARQALDDPSLEHRRLTVTVRTTATMIS
ncbi:MAG TPA: HAMP domain-containing protein, partial [Kofleriaceae bacterium]|nr:HAMP domain-containing protein [Kofleriaceae bacterium]